MQSHRQPGIASALVLPQHSDRYSKWVHPIPDPRKSQIVGELNQFNAD